MPDSFWHSSHNYLGANNSWKYGGLLTKLHVGNHKGLLDNQYKLRMLKSKIPGQRSTEDRLNNRKRSISQHISRTRSISFFQIFIHLQKMIFMTFMINDCFDGIDLMKELSTIGLPDHCWTLLQLLHHSLRFFPFLCRLLNGSFWSFLNHSEEIRYFRNLIPMYWHVTWRLLPVVIGLNRLILLHKSQSIDETILFLSLDNLFLLLFFPHLFWLVYN